MAIHPSEATSHLKALQTVIDNKRPVGFFGGANFDEQELLKKSGLQYIELGVNRAYVFYNQGHDEQARKLAEIATRNGGYLPTNTAAETHEIGILLGYDPESVRSFVMQKFPEAGIHENMKKKLIIKESQYKAILDHMSKEKANTDKLIKEGSRELILGAALIISQAMGKSLSNFNKEVAEKAISNPSIMAKIKSTFEDESKLQALTGEFETVGMSDPSVVLAANAHKVVDEFNRVSREKNIPHLMDVDVINNLKALNPEKKA